MVPEKSCSLSLRRLPTNTQNGGTQAQDHLSNVIQKPCAVEYDCNVNLPNPRPSPDPLDGDYTISSSFNSSVASTCFRHHSLQSLHVKKLSDTEKSSLEFLTNIFNDTFNVNKENLLFPTSFTRTLLMEEERTVKTINFTKGSN